MERKNVNEVMDSFKREDIFTRSDYTFVEYVNELLRFQGATAKFVVGEQGSEYVRMNEAIAKCESVAREKAMTYDPRVFNGIKALGIINKEISVAMAGKSGEDRVAKMFQYVTRPDAKFYRNVYVADETDETELDAVVLTKNGFVILEVKNAKDDITIASDGRILFNNSSCYHDISIGEKMERKRILLRKRLEQEMRNRGLDTEIKIDSLLVFSTPNGTRIHVHDQFKQENYCFKGSLFSRIDGFTTQTEYSTEEQELFADILASIETEQKRFALTFNPDEVKQSFAEMYDALTYVPEEEKVVRIVEKDVEKKTTRRNYWSSFSRAGVAACLVALSGVAMGAASKLYIKG